jgi:hypothetical protein
MEDNGRRKDEKGIHIRNDGVPTQLLVSAAPLPHPDYTTAPGRNPMAASYPGLELAPMTKASGIHAAHTNNDDATRCEAGVTPGF